MKNLKVTLALAATTLLLSNETKAQMPYLGNTSQQTYVPLVNATSVTNGLAWSDTSKFTIPVGFNFQFAGAQHNSFILSETNLMLPAVNGVQSGFAFIGTTLQDRNFQLGAGISPVSYQLSGANGSRIFKMEVRNAGFATERELYSTNNDSISFQIWIHESNSSVEFRFGPSSITHFNDYFQGKVPLGYMQNLNMTTFNFEKYYTLKGDPTNPGMDTLTHLNTVIGLNSFPPAGTVYRFVPKNATTGIGDPTKMSLGKIFPVPAYNELYIESQASHYEIFSLTGTKLAQGLISNGKASVVLTQFAPGTYLIRLMNKDHQTDTQKFIKY